MSDLPTALYITAVEGRTIPLGPELAKLTVIYTGSLYTAMVARNADRRADVRSVLPSARSVVMLGTVYTALLEATGIAPADVEDLVVGFDEGAHATALTLALLATHPDAEAQTMAATILEHLLDPRSADGLIDAMASSAVRDIAVRTLKKPFKLDELVAVVRELSPAE